MNKSQYNEGKKLRKEISRRSHSELKLSPNRLSVKELIESSDKDRIPELIPVRHQRMSESPFVFYRATASIMAGDLASGPSTGIYVQACGDCHLKNFGGYATPERHIVIDMNDFDETHPAHFEWDIKRLATSFILAARENKMSESDAEDISMELIREYRDKVTEFSNMRLLELWYMKLDLEELAKKAKSLQVKKRLSKSLTKADKQNHDTVFYKMTNNKEGNIVISDSPPLIVHPFDMNISMEMINKFLDQYKSTLQPDRRFLFEQYRVADVAIKVVGVGSVGTRCYIVLLLNDNDEPLFIQVKEARQSVLEPYTAPGKIKHQGERIVQGQRMIQNASDIFLGWSTSETGRHFYFRQLKDKKISAVIEEHNKFLLGIYAGYCAKVLARAHCKTGKGAMISGYIGKGDIFPRSITQFSKKYADQTEKDYDEFIKEIKSGQLTTN